MFFFKFQKPGNLEFNMLRRGEIFFASAAELNDAHECRPQFVLNGTRELWTRLADYVLRGACFRSEVWDRTGFDEIHKLLSLGDLLGGQLKKRARNRDVGLEEFYGLFRELLGEELKNTDLSFQSQLILDSTRKFLRQQLPKAIEEHPYIASFSKNATNPTMWGHYADAERGFVVVYTTNNGTLHVESPIKMLHGSRPILAGRVGNFEIGIYNEDGLRLKSVKYGKKPPKVNAFHRLIPHFSYSEEEDHYDVPAMLGGDAKEKEEDAIGLVKFSDWRYEEEIRAFLPVFDVLPPDVRVVRAHVANICGLIFGPRMTEHDKTRAVLCCHMMRESFLKPQQESLPPFIFFQAIHITDRFGFRVAPVGILDGSYFGRYLPIKKANDLGDDRLRFLRDASERIENRRS